MKIQSLGSCAGCIIDINTVRILVDPTISAACAPSIVPSLDQLIQDETIQQNEASQPNSLSSQLTPIPLSLLTSLCAEYTGTKLMYAPSLSSIDLSSIDIVLLSQQSSVLALPYLTSQDTFRGRVFATTPTIEFGKLMMEELIAAQESELATADGQPLSRAIFSELIQENKLIPTNPSLRTPLSPLDLLSIFVPQTAPQHRLTPSNTRVYVDDIALHLLPLFTRSEANAALQRIEPVSFGSRIPISVADISIHCLSSSFCVGGCLWRIESGSPASSAANTIFDAVTSVMSGSNEDKDSQGQEKPQIVTAASSQALVATGSSVATCVRASLLVVPPLSPLTQRHPTALQMQGPVDRVFFMDGAVLYRTPSTSTKSPETSSNTGAASDAATSQSVPLTLPFFSLNDALALAKPLDGGEQSSRKLDSGISSMKSANFPNPLQIPGPTHPLGVSPFSKTLPSFVKYVVSLLSSSNPSTVVIPMGMYNQAHDILHQIIGQMTISAMNNQVIILSRTARAVVDTISTFGEYLTPQIMSKLTSVQEHVATRISDSMHAMDAGSLGFGIHQKSGSSRKITYAPTSSILTAKMDDGNDTVTSTSQKQPSGPSSTTSKTTSTPASASNAPVMRKWWSSGPAFSYIAQLYHDIDFATGSDLFTGKTPTHGSAPSQSRASMSRFDPPAPQRPTSGISRIRIFPDVDSCLPLLQQRGLLVICEEHLIPYLLAALTPASHTLSSSLNASDPSRSSKATTAASSTSAVSATPRVLVLDPNAVSTADLQLQRPSLAVALAAQRDHTMSMDDDLALNVSAQSGTLGNSSSSPFVTARIEQDVPIKTDEKTGDRRQIATKVEALPQIKDIQVKTESVSDTSDTVPQKSTISSLAATQMKTENLRASSSLSYSTSSSSSTSVSPLSSFTPLTHHSHVWHSAGAPTTQLCYSATSCYTASTSAASKTVNPSSRVSNTMSGTPWEQQTAPNRSLAGVRARQAFWCALWERGKIRTKSNLPDSNVGGSPVTVGSSPSVCVDCWCNITGGSAQTSFFPFDDSNVDDGDRASKRFKGDVSLSVAPSADNGPTVDKRTTLCSVCTIRSDWRGYVASLNDSIAFMSCPLSPALCASQLNALLERVKPQQVILPQEISALALALGKVEIPVKQETAQPSSSSSSGQSTELTARYAQLTSVLDKLIASHNSTIDGNTTFPSTTRAKALIQQAQTLKNPQASTTGATAGAASVSGMSARDTAIARVAAGLMLPCDVTILPHALRNTVDLPWSKWSLPRAFLALQRQRAPLWRSSTASTLRSVCLTPSIASSLHTTHIYAAEDAEKRQLPTTHRFGILRKNGPEFTFSPNETIVNNIPVASIPVPPESSPAALIPARIAAPSGVTSPALSVTTARVSVSTVGDTVVLHPPTPYVAEAGVPVPKLYGEVHIETLSALLLHHFSDLTLAVKGQAIARGSTVTSSPGAVLQFTSVSNELAVTVTNGPPVRVRVHGNKKESRQLALKCLEQATICIAPLAEGGSLPVVKDEHASCHDVHGCIDV